MNLTIAELARAVDKSETYVRQHIHRRHLNVRKHGRNVSVTIDEAVRWARERGLSFDLPVGPSATMGTMNERTARMTVLTWHAPGVDARNLFTLIRHRRPDALGPWTNEPSDAWSCVDLGHELRLYRLDASFQRCQALIDHVLEFGTLEIDGQEIRYALEPIPRRHWAYRDKRPFSNASMRSPFSRHSAEIVEYWSFARQPRERWLKVLESLEDEVPSQLRSLGLPLNQRLDRVGNLMVAGAEDAISCKLSLHRDQTLRLHVDADDLLPGAYRATVWASHCRDEVLRRETSVTKGQTVIEVASDVDHIGFAIHRAVDQQCIDLMEAFLVKEITFRMNVDSGPTLEFQDRRGRSIHKVRPSGSISTNKVDSDGDKAGFDKGIRRLWLDRQIHEREAAARKEGNFMRFRRTEFNEALQCFVRLLREGADQSGAIYLADPYFMKPLTGDEGEKLYLEMFAAVAGRSLRVLCTQRENGNKPPWWSKYPVQLTSHVRVRAFLEQGSHRPGFHDRYLITPVREVVVTNSFNGWLTHGVTFASHPYGVYRTEAEQLWLMDLESKTADLFVREIGDGR